MVQALAFAEIFLGLILADAGYKGVTVTRVVKGEAGETVAPNPLGGGATPAGAPAGAAPEPAAVGASVEGANLSLYPAVAAAKGLLESQLKRAVKVSEVESLYAKYHPEKTATAQNHPPTRTSFESLTGAVEP